MRELGVDLGQGFYFGQPTEQADGGRPAPRAPARRARLSGRPLARGGSVPAAVSERDLFANFERMRREMDELFGDVFDRGLAPAPPRRLLARRRRLLRRRPAAGGRARRPGRHRPGRARARDPRARADPRRPAARAGDRPRSASTSSSRSSTGRSGASSRSAPTSTPTAPRATYEDGMLVVELPDRRRRADPRTVPIEPGRRRVDASTSRRSATAPAPWRWAPRRCPTSCRCCRCATRSPSPTR